MSEKIKVQKPLVVLHGDEMAQVAFTEILARFVSLPLDIELVEIDLSAPKRFHHLSKGRTTIIVAHRLATVKKADRIIVLDKGKIVAQGNHDKLINEKGLYAHLATLQFTHGST